MRSLLPGDLYRRREEYNRHQRSGLLDSETYIREIKRGGSERAITSHLNRRQKKN